jgi:hypothetical protein
MRRALILTLLVTCFGPLVLVLVAGLLMPKSLIADWGMPIWLLIFGGGLIGLVGIFSLAAFSWNGTRPLKRSYLAVTLTSFIASLSLFLAKAGLLGDVGILLYYGGWLGLFFIVALYLPVFGTVLLAWSSRRYIFFAEPNASSLNG